MYRYAPAPSAAAWLPAVLCMAAAASAALLIACSPGRGAASESADSLALLYSFDARSGNTVRDLSGRGHHGTAFGATWAEGRYGRALRFDGVDDYVQAVGYYPFSDANGLTAEAWVKLTGRRLFSTVVVSRNCCNFRMLITPTLTPFYDPGMFADFEVTSYTFEFGKWTHYALVVAGGERAKVLIDGQVVSDTNVGVPEVVPSMYEAMLIGGIPDTSFFIEGSIDELRIYARALSDDEIRADMKSSTTAFMVQRAERLVNRLAQQGGDTSAATQKLRESRAALERTDDESAQNLAYETEQVVRAERVKHEARGGVTSDAGKVLLSTLIAVFAFGTLLALVLIWGAWKAAS